MIVIKEINKMMKFLTFQLNDILIQYWKYIQIHLIFARQVSSYFYIFYISSVSSILGIER